MLNWFCINSSRRPSEWSCVVYICVPAIDKNDRILLLTLIEQLLFWIFKATDNAGLIWLCHNFYGTSSDWYDSLIFGADYFVKWKQTLQCLVSPHALWLLRWSTTTSQTHWWFTQDNVYSVFAKVDKVAIKRKRMVIINLLPPILLR